MKLIIALVVFLAVSSSAFAEGTKTREEILPLVPPGVELRSKGFLNDEAVLLDWSVVLDGESIVEVISIKTLNYRMIVTSIGNDIRRLIYCYKDGDGNIVKSFSGKVRSDGIMESKANNLSLDEQETLLENAKKTLQEALKTLKIETNEKLEALIRAIPKPT